MRLSFKWLNEYLNSDEEHIRKNADMLNETLTEVDGIESFLPKFKDVYIGKIIHLEKHPNADKLQIAKIEIGENKILNIVCGAQNIYEGMIVPVAIVGAKLYEEDGEEFEIKKAKLRGIDSEGMLCSARELSISKDHSGIFDLSSDHNLKIGQKLDDIFTDTVLKIENKAITHRPDCFSHYGIAREIAAISDKVVSPIQIPKLIKHEIDKDQYLLSNDIFNSKNEIKLKVEGYTRRYSTITIKGVIVENSPAWLVSRLMSIGLRPINNIVDLTNYIMFDLGQPLHAFDMDYTGKNFEIRTGKPPERILTLDNIEHELTKDDITITDGKKPLDIGGIIGGEESGIKNTTKNIVLVSDNFDPAMLRRTSWRMGIRTDAVTIYEKNIDPNMTIQGIFEFVKLLKSIYPNASLEISEILDYYPNPMDEFKPIKLSLDDINNLIGINIPVKKIEEILNSLGIIVKKEENELFLQVPSRRQDLNIKEDIIEEIIRLYGYSKIQVTPYMYKLKNVSKYIGRDEEIELKTYLADNGYFEIEPYAFGSKIEEESLGIKSNKVNIKNPVNLENDILKSSVLPEILKSVMNNARFYDSFKLFSFTRIFEDNKKGLPNEIKRVGGANFAKFNKLKRKSIDEKTLFFETKAILDGLFERINVKNVKFKIPSQTNNPVDNLIYIPDLTLNMYVKDTYIGRMGLVSEEIANRYDLDNTFAVFELVWEPIFNSIDRNYKLKEYSKFPSVDYDISFYINEGIPAGEILEIVEKSAVQDLIDIKFIDEYKKDNVKSLTLRITFNSFEETLTLEKIEERVGKVKEIIQDNFKEEGLTLR